jgi:hypothetical protein
VRTEQEIQEDVYRELPALSPDLVAYYKFNQSSGTLLPDNSGNGNGGTLTNMEPATDWVSSTAPIPYYTIQDGDWSDYNIWGVGQIPPIKDWSRVVIDHDIIQDQNQGLYDLVINTGASLTINPGYGLTMFGDIANYAGTSGLILEADATGMGQLIHNTIGVEATVEEYLSSQQWHYVSSPITNATIETYFNIYLMNFNEPTGVWTYMVNPVTTPMNVGNGYAAWASNALTGNTTVSYEGPLNTGDITYSSLDYTPISNNTGYNLVGNPYPSSLEWNSNWTTTNLDATAYFWDGSANVTWNRLTGMGTAANGVIPSTQGFVVMANASGASFTFPQSERIHGAQSFYKESSIINQSITFEVEGNGYSDKMIVGFSSDATNSFDHNYDAYDLQGVEEAPQFYTIGENVEYAVNILNSESNENVIPVGLDVGTPGIYSIRANDLEGFDGNSVVIEDIKENTFIDLAENDVYNFTVGLNDASHRFNIHFKSGAMGVEDNAAKDVSIYSNEDVVYINKPADLTGNITVFNMMGQEVLSAKATAGTMMNLKVTDGTGYYVVKLQSGDKLITQKVFIR